MRHSILPIIRSFILTYMRVKSRYIYRNPDVIHEKMIKTSKIIFIAFGR